MTAAHELLLMVRALRTAKAHAANARGFLRALVEAEREACARVAEITNARLGECVAESIAAAIRARGAA